MPHTGVGKRVTGGGADTVGLLTRPTVCRQLPEAGGIIQPVPSSTWWELYRVTNYVELLFYNYQTTDNPRFEADMFCTLQLHPAVAVKHQEFTVCNREQSLTMSKDKFLT